MADTRDLRLPTLSGYSESQKAELQRGVEGLRAFAESALNVGLGTVLGIAKQDPQRWHDY